MRPIKLKSHPRIDKAKKPKVPSASEYAIHCEIADYLSGVIRSPSRWTTIEVSNQQGGERGRNKQMQLKRKGVTTGFPDIMIIWRHKYGTLSSLVFFEVKAVGGKLTEKQSTLHDELRNEGHYVYTVNSVEEVEKILKDLGVI